MADYQYSDEEVLEALGRKATSLPENHHEYSDEEVLAALPQQQPSLLDKTKSFLKAIPPEFAAAYHQARTNPSRASKVALGEILNTAQGVANYYKDNGFIPSFNKAPEGKMNADYTKVLGAGPSQQGDIVLGGAPFLAAPELLETKGAGALQRLMAKAVEGGLTSKFMGGDTEIGALLGAVPYAPRALKGAGREIKSIPADLLRGTATPEELEANLAATAGKEVPLGEVTKGPLTKQFFENALVNTPGSGGQKIYGNMREQLDTEGKKLLYNLAGSEDIARSEPNAIVKDALLSVQKELRKTKNNMYNDVDKVAQEENHELSLPSFKEKSKGAMDLIENSPLLQANPKIRSFFNKVSGYNAAVSPKESKQTSQILQASGKPFETISNEKAPTIKEANLVKNELWHTGHQLDHPLASATDRMMGAKFKELSSAIGSDIGQSIEEKGSEKLNRAYTRATANYKHSFARLADKDIYKYFDKDRTSDSIARDIINPSRENDRFSKIKKINDLLPQSKRNLLGFAYLRNAVDKEGNLDVKKMAQLSQKLGPRQFNSLFSPEMREQVSSFVRLRGMSEDALNAMHNPKTGARGVKSWATILLPAYEAAKYATAAGGPVMGAIAGVGTAGAIPLAARHFTQYLTDPAVRAKLVQRMIENENLKNAPVSENKLVEQLSRQLPRMIASSQNNRNKK
jgi:hypothetical protein